MKHFTSTLLPLLVFFFLFFAVSLAFENNEVKENPYTITSPYLCPLSVGSEEWSRMDIFERYEACRIPDELIDKFTTEALLLSVLDYPFICTMKYYSSMEEGIATVQESFPPLAELLQRVDVIDALEEYLSTCQPEEYSYGDAKYLHNYLLKEQATRWSFTNEVNENPYTITSPYQYPVSVGSEEWNMMAIFERYEVSRIPDELIDKFTTEALLLSVLDYPFISTIMAYSSMEEGITTIQRSFPPLTELLQRVDVIDTLEEYFSNYQSEENSDVNTSLLKYGVAKYLHAYLLKPQGVENSAHDFESYVLADIRERHPFYCEYSTEKGLSILVYQWAEDSYTYSLVPDKEDPEDFHPYTSGSTLTAPQIKSLLSFYNLKDEDIVLHHCPCILSSYAYASHSGVDESVQALFDYKYAVGKNVTKTADFTTGSRGRKPSRATYIVDQD